MTNRSSDGLTIGKLLGLAAICGLGLCVVIGFWLWAGPAYRIYAAEQEGKAILAKAEYARKAQIVDAQAKKESAKYLKEGADEIQSSLSPQYLEYLNIQMKEEVGKDNNRAVYFFEDGRRTPNPVVSVPQRDHENR